MKYFGDKRVGTEIVVSVLERRTLGVNTDPLGGGQEVLGLEVLGGKLCEIGGLGGDLGQQLGGGGQQGPGGLQGLVVELDAEDGFQGQAGARTQAAYHSPQLADGSVRAEEQDQGRDGSDALGLHHDAKRLRAVQVHVERGAPRARAVLACAGQQVTHQGVGVVALQVHGLLAPAARRATPPATAGPCGWESSPSRERLVRCPRAGRTG